MLLLIETATWELGEPKELVIVGVMEIEFKGLKAALFFNKGNQ